MMTIEEEIAMATVWALLAGEAALGVVLSVVAAKWIMSSRSRTAPAQHEAR